LASSSPATTHGSYPFETQPLLRKSSHSGGTSDTNCVELADLATTIGVRDSKNPHGPILTLSRGSAALR
jgi:Domain of unknown function (DUF397)